MALADCDGGGINNLIECQNGGDPLNPVDDCTSALADGADICAFVLANPASPLALSDCDGGGVSNLIECQNGGDPLNPIDDCAAALADGMDVCAFVLANPTSPLALADCDGGGINNLIECQNGSDPLNPGDDCTAALLSGVDVCAFILANPTSIFAQADCDGGGISNLIECQNGGDPLNPLDDCASALIAGTDICPFVLANPTSPLALADCDGGGISNLIECQNGEDPLDPIDDCASALAVGADICAFILANPTSPLALADCDGGGISNLIECQNGEDPLDPSDDCQAAIDSGVDVCAFILANPNSIFAQADCDGGGISNLIECQNGGNPLDPMDDCVSALADGTNICAFVIFNPTSPLALADCDGGGVNNLIECQNGGNPFDPNDDCASALAEGADICAFVLANPTSPLALADCDGGGISNLIECQNGGDPLNPIDDCAAALADGMDVCAFVLANPTSPLATADCDGGGINNLIECQNGFDPLNSGDDCSAAIASGIDVCAFILANPTSPFALADCDGGGISNLIECQNGGDPLDPIDDCSSAIASGADVCVFILANPTSPFALADCDGGGISNLIECQNGGDPLDAIDDCIAALADGVNICAFILANPTSPLALADCDNGGVSNLVECMDGNDPLDPSDDLFDLSLMKLLSPGQPAIINLGDQVSFDFVVTNLTPPIGDNITIQDVIPNGFSFDPALNPSWTEVNGIATTTLSVAGGSLPAGGLGLNQSARVTIVLTVNRNVPQSTALENFGSITSEDDNPSNDSDTASVMTAFTDAGITKVVSPSQSMPVQPGGQVTYDITVTNFGTSHIESVYITDNYPSTFLTLNDPAWVPGMAGEAIHAAVVNLDPGDSFTVSITFDVSMFTPGMALLNTAAITSLFNENDDPLDDSNPFNDQDEAMINVANTLIFDMSLNKTTSTSTPAPNFFGDEIEFNVEVCNDGNVSIENFVIEDVLDPGYQFLVGNAANTAWTNVGGNVYRSNIATLPANTCVTLTMRCLILNNGGPWNNNAEIISATTPLGASITGTTDASGLANNNDLVSLMPTSPSGAIGNCVFKDLNGNGVREFSEPGIPGIRVELFNQFGSLVSITMTDDMGNYMFMNLQAGSYYIRVILQDSFEFTQANQGNSDNNDSDVDGSNGPGTTAIINLGANEVDMSIYAGLFRCVPFGDLIWLDVNGNNRQDPNENGVNGVRVDIFKRVNNSFVRELSTYSGHKPGTGSDDGYWKVCLPPGEYYVKYNVPANLNSVVPMVGGQQVDSNVTDAFGANTTNAFTLVSCTENCDVDAGFSTASGFISDTGVDLIPSFAEATVLEASGSQQGLYNQLEWKYENLQSQAEVSHFEISKLVDGEYVKIGQILSDDNTNAFSFEDYDVLTSGLYEYLITEVDYDENVLSISSITLEKLDVTVELLVFPNPVVDNMTIQVRNEKAAEQLSITLYDVQGKQISQLKLVDIDIEIGTHKYEMDVSSLDAGIYLINVEVDEELFTERVLIVD